MTSQPVDSRYVLLLRGINVNPSTLVSMGELRDILAGLGYQNVRTLLRSGNVILDSAGAPDALTLEAAITAGTGVRSAVVVLTAAEFRALVEANPLLDAGDDLSKLVITFLGGDIVADDAFRPTDEELAPERLVVTPRAIYQWCPDGILQSRLTPSWCRQFVPVATTRNVRTANRILEMLDVAKSDLE